MKKWGTSLAGEMDRVIDAVGTTMRDVDSIVRTGQRRAALKAGTDRPAAGMTLGQLSDDPSSVANSSKGSRNRPGSTASPTSNAPGPTRARFNSPTTSPTSSKESPPRMWASLSPGP